MVNRIEIPRKRPIAGSHYSLLCNHHHHHHHHLFALCKYIHTHTSSKHTAWQQGRQAALTVAI